MSEVIGTLTVQVMHTGINGALEDDPIRKQIFYSDSAAIVKAKVKEMRSEIEALLREPALGPVATFAAVQSEYIESNRDEYGQRTRFQF